MKHLIVILLTLLPIAVVAQEISKLEEVLSHFEYDKIPFGKSHEEVMHLFDKIDFSEGLTRGINYFSHYKILNKRFPEEIPYGILKQEFICPKGARMYLCLYFAREYKSNDPFRLFMAYKIISTGGGLDKFDSLAEAVYRKVGVKPREIHNTKFDYWYELEKLRGSKRQKWDRYHPAKLAKWSLDDMLIFLIVDDSDWEINFLYISKNEWDNYVKVRDSYQKEKEQKKKEKDNINIKKVIDDF